jgi:hypothetical protein
MFLINALKNLIENYNNNDNESNNYYIDNDNDKYDLEIKLRIFGVIDAIMELKDLEYYYKGINNDNSFNNNFLLEIKYLFLNLGILDVLNKSEILNRKFNNDNEELFSCIYCLRQKFS